MLCFGKLSFFELGVGIGRTRVLLEGISLTFNSLVKRLALIGDMLSNSWEGSLWFLFVSLNASSSFIDSCLGPGLDYWVFLDLMISTGWSL